MRHSALLHFTLGFGNATTALRPSKHCFDGCELTLNYVDFNDTDLALSKQARTCQGALHAKSLYSCISLYCEDNGREKWLRSVDKICKTAVNETLPPWNIVANYTADDITRMRRLRAEEGMWNSQSPPLSEVVVPDEAFIDRAVRTLNCAYFEIKIHRAYGIAMYYFWVVVVSIGVCWRLSALIQHIRRQEWNPIPHNEQNVEHAGLLQHPYHCGPAYALLKRYIIIPATFGYRCSQNIAWCTIPPRIQSLTIFCFVLINILLCCISYPVFAENLYWPQVSTQLWRYVSDRTGVISLANFPLIWLFGTRNNVLIWLTGWGFGTYNSFHRWVARVATVQAIVHSIGYTEMVFERGGLSLFMKYWTKHYFWNGEVATILMCALSAFSVYGLRRRHYEVFLITHIILSVIVLLTTFYHVEIFNGEWNIFIWPCVIVWAVDRSLRAVRILAFNRKFWNTEATAEYDAASNLIRLEVPYEQSLLRPQAGTYYYISGLNNISYAHQTHPFTLAYTITEKTTRLLTSCTSSTTVLSNEHPIRSRPFSTTSSESECLLPSRSPSLVFLVRPYSGFTSQLRDTCLSSPRILRVLVDGPYGSTTKALHTFPHLIFVAGGTGITVALAYLSTLSDVSCAIGIHIVWAVREHALMNEVLRRDIRSDVLSDERVRITVHVTQDEGLKDDLLGHWNGNVKVKAGRPDVGLAIEEAAVEAGRLGLAVVGCGPAQLADQARRACVTAVGSGWTSVEYFEESFKW